VTVSARAGASETASESAPEEEKLIAVLQDGDHFGEIALIQDAPRMATVRTRTDCVFLTLVSDEFRELLRHSPELRRKFEEISRQRLDESNTIAGPHASGTSGC
jgi:ATP-binding cassette subfamily B protein